MSHPSHQERNDWPAQEPTLDFAARTTQLVLGLQQAGAPASKRMKSGVRWRKPGFVLLAALLASASAWGALELRRHLASSEPPKLEPVAQWSPAPAPATAKALVKRAEPEPASPEPTAQPKSKPARTRIAAPPATSASAEPPAQPLPKPRVPPCWCDPGAVLCGCAE